jgi:hypothetical protein
VNSKAWSEAASADVKATADELYWYPIEPDMHDLGADCTRMPVHVAGAAKAAHAMPSYPR